MHSDDMYKFIGYAVVIIFTIYVVSKSVSFQTGMLVEGMTSNDSGKKKTKTDKKDEIKKGTEALKKQNDDDEEGLTNIRESLNLNDTNLLSEYHRKLDLLYDAANLELVRYTINASETIINGPSTSSSITHMTQIHMLKTFLDNMEYVSSALDTVSSGSSGGDGGGGGGGGSLM